MNATYEWLYENYAQELHRECRKTEEAAIRRFAAATHLSSEDQIDLADCIASLRFYCGVRSFALGLQTGVRLMEELSPTAS